MCGIAGAILPKATPEQRWEIARKLLWDLQERGEDATGVGFHRNGGPVVVKAPTDASTFIRSEAFRELRDNLPETFILHARKTTRGNEKNNLNNHPVTSKASGIILVHNGTIDDSDIRAKDENGVNPWLMYQHDAEVDTESIVRVIETMRFIPRNEDLTIDKDATLTTPKDDWRSNVSWMRAIDDACVNFDGSFACAMLVPDEENTIYLWRHEKPLFVAYVPEYEGIVFASTNEILQAGLSSVDYLMNTFPVPNTTLNYPVSLDNKELMRIERTANDEEPYDIDTYTIDPPKYTTSNSYNHKFTGSKGKGVEQTQLANGREWDS